jgi:hypothetical protein
MEDRMRSWMIPDGLPDDWRPEGCKSCNPCEVCGEHPDHCRFDETEGEPDPFSDRSRL